MNPRSPQIADLQGTVGDGHQNVRLASIHISNKADHFSLAAACRHSSLMR